MNLLVETMAVLETHGKKLEDILWVGCVDFCIDIDEFIRLADVVYDNGYGAPEVAKDLIVVGAGWYLERGEHYGSEWWEYKEIPKRPDRVVSIKRLVIRKDMIGWETLKSINELSEGNEG